MSSASYRLLAAKKPIEPSTKQTIASGQPPGPTAASPTVASTPSAVNAASQGFLRPARSVIAPSSGASRTTTALAMPLPTPRRKVVSGEAAPSFQKPPSMSGTNAVTTRSENAELAQS